MMSKYLRGLRAKVGHDLLILPSVTVLLFDDEGRVLLVRHSNEGLWVAPGGMIEPDEDPAAAARREMFEETACEVDIVKVLGVFGGPEFRVRYANGDEVGYVMTVYEARSRGGAPRPDGNETLEARYFPPEEVASLPTARWLPIVLRAVLEPI
jgi:8-oxo-dGTP pyrophosphatase MutT (NUDIX family)